MRACVRNSANDAKVAHLLALNGADLRGCVELFEADDTLEGVNAFLEERDPRWRNR